MPEARSIHVCWPILTRRRQHYTNSAEKYTTKMSDLVVILTTLPDDDRAVGVARTLVAERLAACVNVHTPMVSIYRWKTELEQEPERQVVIKTTRDRMEQVRARLRDLHPYELPEWIVLPGVEASPEYADWVKAETAVPGT